MRKVVVTGLATIATAALLAGCASAPTVTKPTATPKVANYLPCMVSDSGGFDDHSFNQIGLEGLQSAAKDLGIKEKHVQSNSDSDYAPNISNLVSQKCSLIITVGFLLADATGAAAKANPSINFATIDDDSNTESNVQPITFRTDQASFLGGYAAAAYSKTGVVGTFGGISIPAVNIFLEGFTEGVAYYNKQKGKDVKVVGWNSDTQTGSFTGGFAAGTEALAAAQAEIDANADVIFPVGGPIYQSAAQAIKTSGKPIVLIGVDADVYYTDPTVRSILLTSVEKGVGTSSAAVVKEAAAGKFTNTPYVGTLKNDGVGLAPFHDFKSKIPSSLTKEIASIKADIISGKITVGK
ncbi:MAG: family transporter substrate-binding protein [Microbacteriaceae bacterium]|nr:family transporter substrate-binding protein [Microbacteriaceae bacterium]